MATCAALALPVTLGSSPALATDNDQSVVNYSYAVVFGTGAYEVRDQTAFVFRLPLSYRLREPERDRPGINLMLPVLAGFYDYEESDVFEARNPKDAATMSFVPGVEFEYAVSDHWRLTPSGQLGLGRDIDNRDDSVIYVAGISSRYRFFQSDKLRIALGNSAAYSGYSPDDGEAQSLGILGLGIDMSYAWAIRLFGAGTDFATSLIYYQYLDNPSFDQGDGRSKSIGGEFEWSLALKFREPCKLLGVEFERLGLGLRYGGNIKGLTVITRFPF